MSCNGLDCSICHLVETISYAITLLTGISFAVATLFLVIAGLVRIFSHGNKSLLEKSKKRAKASLIAFFLILTSWLIIGEVFRSTGALNGDQWWFINCEENETESQPEEKTLRDFANVQEFIKSGETFGTLKNIGNSDKFITDLASMEDGNLIQIYNIKRKNESDLSNSLFEPVIAFSKENNQIEVSNVGSYFDVNKEAILKSTNFKQKIDRLYQESLPSTNPFVDSKSKSEMQEESIGDVFENLVEKNKNVPSKINKLVDIASDALQIGETEGLLVEKDSFSLNNDMPDAKKLTSMGVSVEEAGQMPYLDSMQESYEGAIDDFDQKIETALKKIYQVDPLRLKMVCRYIKEIRVLPFSLRSMQAAFFHDGIIALRPDMPVEIMDQVIVHEATHAAITEEYGRACFTKGQHELLALANQIGSNPSIEMAGQEELPQQVLPKNVKDGSKKEIRGYMARRVINVVGNEGDVSFNPGENLIERMSKHDRDKILQETLQYPSDMLFLSIRNAKKYQYGGDNKYGLNNENEFSIDDRLEKALNDVVTSSKTCHSSLPGSLAAHCSDCRGEKTEPLLINSDKESAMEDKKFIESMRPDLEKENMLPEKRKDNPSCKK